MDLIYHFMNRLASTVVESRDDLWMSKKKSSAAIAQLGERQTEDLKVPGSIPGLGMSPPAPAPRVGLGGRDYSFRA